ncbi:1807_t:CDS:2 [Acaulospora colombiana]|uniref:1807_t:CDS:1 n=1 Tax=Acaulospora colombiana TaxID=27376 RepID=A0ACA9MGR2_9GLOM|nr:1807_t:CDS:2 [Acaulospora colombiana]
MSIVYRLWTSSNSCLEFASILPLQSSNSQRPMVGKRSSGTGQIIAAFKNDEIDIGIALTDALIAGIANGNPDYRLVGQYITTPLNWSVLLPQTLRFEGDDDGDFPYRKGCSGSQVMAAVMAMQQGKYFNLGRGAHVDLALNNNIDGLIRSVNDGTTSAFMWEW